MLNNKFYQSTIKRFELAKKPLLKKEAKIKEELKAVVAKYKEKLDVVSGELAFLNEQIEKIRKQSSEETIAEAANVEEPQEAVEIAPEPLGDMLATDEDTEVFSEETDFFSPSVNG